MAIIIKPLITEKSSALTEKGNKYSFIVRPEANKVDIKNEIESRYNVHVTAVNTMVYGGKRHERYTRSGLLRGRSSAFKKAVISLQEGESIDFYSNIK